MYFKEVNMDTLYILAPGILPIPAIKGGAVEGVVSELIRKNEEFKKYKFVVFSYDPDKTMKNSADNYSNTEIVYIDYGRISKAVDFIIKVVVRLTKNRSIYSSKLLRNAISEIKKREQDSGNIYVLVEGNFRYILPVKSKMKCNLIFHAHNDCLNSSLDCADIIRGCDLILCTSNVIKDRIEEVCESNCKVLYCRLNHKYYALDESDSAKKDELIKKYDLGNFFTLVFCGRITSGKGVLELVKAFNRLEDKDIKLIIIGGINFSCNDEDNYLKSVYEEAKKNPNIIFTGYIPNNELKYYYGISDIGVIPSKCNDAYTLTKLEMMSAGLPLIVSNDGGVPENLTKEMSIVVDKNNMENELLKAIEYYYNQKDLKSISDESRKNGEIINDENAYYLEFADLIDGVSQ
jgi:glycosyltransferase involved in cell wall biosynthesis